MTSPQPTPPTVDPEQVRAALRAWAEAVAPAVRALVEGFAHLAEQLREAGVVDDQGRPAHRDRPAWQSPYGPPPRRRQH